MRRPPWGVVVVLFLVALGVRLLFWAEWNRAGILALPVVDAMTYDIAARGILTGTWPGPSAFWQAPLYPFALAGLYEICGWNWAAARFAQAMLGATTCVVTVAVARQLVPFRVACGAGWICALYGPLIYFEGQLLRSTLATLLLILWIWLLQLAWTGSPSGRDGHRQRGLWLWSLVGLALGVSALCRENALILAPALAVALATSSRQGPPLRRSLAIAAMGMGVLGAIAPVTLHNLRHDSGKVLISSSGGLNFFIGNNAEAVRTEQIRPGRHWDDLVARPRREAGATEPSARSAFFYAQARRWIREDPAGFLRNLGRKTVALLSAHEQKRNQDLYEAREASWVLRALMWRAGGAGFPFGLVAPLALVGLLGLTGLLGRHGRNHRLGLLGLITVVYAAGIVLYLPAARYRLPLVPLAAILAAWAVYGGWHAWRAHRAARAEGHRSGELWRWIAALLGCAVLCNGGWVVATDNPAEQRYLRGTALLELERPAEALQQFEAAVALDPSDAEAWTNLAALRGSAGDSRGALEAAEHAVAAAPDEARGHGNLALALASLGRQDEALAAWRTALRLEPDFFAARAALARGLAASEDLDGALEVIRGGPAPPAPDAGPQAMLIGSLEARAGRWPAAARAFEDATRLDPANPDAWNNLGIALAQSGRVDDAVAILREGLQRVPGNPRLRSSLARWEAAQRDQGGGAASP